MSLVRQALKQAKIDFDDYWLWSVKASKGRHKKLFDAYEKDLKRWNDDQEELGVWIQKHVDEPVVDFNKGLARRGLRQKRLSRRVQVRLAKIFEVMDMKDRSS